MLCLTDGCCFVISFYIPAGFHLSLFVPGYSHRTDLEKLTTLLCLSGLAGHTFHCTSRSGTAGRLHVVKMDCGVDLDLLGCNAI
jgi:hypothetical protein